MTLHWCPLCATDCTLDSENRCQQCGTILNVADAVIEKGANQHTHTPVEPAESLPRDTGRNGCTRPDRYLAAWMDAVIAILIVLCVADAISSYLLSSKSAAVNVALGVFVGSVFFLYFLLFETFTSTTPGKFMFGLHVEHLDGTRCNFRAALLRTVTRIIEVDPVIFGCLIAAIVVRCSKRRQRWGDILAGTIVTDKPPRYTARSET